AHRRVDGVKYGISKIIVHQGYVGGAYKDHDIALLKLSKPAILGQKVNTVCLPTQNEVVQKGAKCYVTGWGKMYGSLMFHQAEKLQQGRTPVVDHNTCKMKLDKFYVNEKTMLCAGGARSSACSGDSGGPLVCEQNGRWVLHGAVSWGTNYRCPVDMYVVYVRISSYINWIKDFT
ncbi:hypothetical protein QZH41_015177, partial [Actinostola sp. cb2023]